MRKRASRVMQLSHRPFKTKRSKYLIRTSKETAVLLPELDEKTVIIVNAMPPQAAGYLSLA